MITENSITNLKSEEVKIRKTIINVHTRRWMGDVLFATDMLSLLLAILVSLQARHMLFLTVDSPNGGIYVVLGGTIAYLFLRKGLYPPVGMHYSDELRNIITTSTLAFLIMIGVTFVFKTTFAYSRLVLISTWAMCVPLMPLNRYLIRRFLIHLGLWGEAVVIVGDLQKAQSLANYFKIRQQYGLMPVAVLSDKPRLGDPVGPCPILPICRIKVYARNLSVKTILIVLEDLNKLDVTIDNYRDAFTWMIVIKDKFDNYGLTFLKSLDFMDVFGLQVKNNLLNTSTHISKRIMDITAAFLGLLFLTPFFALIAVIIKLESRGDIFYHQPRLGKGGQKFNLLKFRTMHENAGQILKEELARNPKLKKEWDKFQKLKNDPRITPVGRFLRRFSLDELPQLWNVLKGEMSLVGPRPIMVDQLKLYGETIKESFRVTPGITGLWQVSGRSSTTFERRAELDVEYIQRWSAWLDLYILFKTFKIVIWHDGAY